MKLQSSGGVSTATSAGLRLRMRSFHRLGNHFSTADQYSHLHVSFLDDAKRSIDPRLLMADIAPSMQITATDGGDNGIVNYEDADTNEMTRNVAWNEDLGAWVTIDSQSGSIGNEHLVYDRSAQKDGGSEVYWKAWVPGQTVEQMERVVWDNSEDVKKWIRWDSSSNSWYRDENNKRSIWDSNSQSWKSE